MKRTLAAVLVLSMAFSCCLMFASCGDSAITVRDFVEDDEEKETQKETQALTTEIPETTSDGSTDAAPKKLIVGTSGDYEPFSFFENGSLVGFDKDLMTEIAKELGYSKDEISFYYYNFAQMFVALENGECDLIISGILETEGRNEYGIASDSYISHEIKYENGVLLDEPYVEDLVIYGRDPDLIDEINEAIKTLKNNGTQSSLVDKWLGQEQH